jgi:hypothetical protein
MSLYLTAIYISISVIYFIPPFGISNEQIKTLRDDYDKQRRMRAE